MPSTKPFSILARQIDENPERRNRVDEMNRAFRDAERLMKLRDQPSASHLNINGSAGADVTTNGDLRIDPNPHENDAYLSTLRDYIEEMGGELEITARFPDGEVIKVG